MKRIWVLALLAPLLFAGCARSPDSVLSSARSKSDVARLALWLPGDYGTSRNEQWHVRRMTEFGRAFYVRIESSPPAQAVLMIEPRDGGFVVTRWRITRPEKYADAWQDEKKLATLTIYDLRECEGCASSIVFDEQTQEFALVPQGGPCTAEPGSLEDLPPGLHVNERELRARIALLRTSPIVPVAPAK